MPLEYQLSSEQEIKNGKCAGKRRHQILIIAFDNNFLQKQKHKILSLGFRYYAMQHRVRPRLIRKSTKASAIKSASSKRDVTRTD